jgi:hypothetical protein
VRLPPVPLWFALIGLIGNSAVAAVLLERGESIWLLFLGTTLISYATCLRAGSTAVRTAEKESPCTCSDSGLKPDARP